MITNERQHRITKAEIRRFEDAIDRGGREGPASGVHPRLYEAMLEGFRSQLRDLKDQVRSYEALREGRIKKRVLHSLMDFPSALIEGRIASRLTQKQLAGKLGIPEQQVQRYEGTRYAGASLDRLQEVADAVGVSLRETVEFNVKEVGGRSTAAVSKRGKKMSARHRKTGRATSAAGKALASKRSSKTAKRSPASGLAQVRSSKVGSSSKGSSKRAASAKGKTLRSKRASKATKRAASSSQRVAKKRR